MLNICPNFDHLYKSSLNCCASKKLTLLLTMSCFNTKAAPIIKLNLIINIEML